MPVIIDIESVAVNVVTTESNGLYPIREVSRLTGINPVTLRAWERRYGFIEPKRTNSGHRLYSLTDIETVRRVQGWIERGVSVSKVGELLARGTPAISQHEGVQSTEYREWQLQTEDHLTEDEEFAGFVFTRPNGDGGGRNNGNHARDEAAQPGLKADIDEAFHDGLTGERRRYG